MKEFSVVGKRLQRYDAKEKVTGQEIYICDFKLPRMLYGKILRSPYPHANILSIDVHNAEKIRGVKAVITAKDVPSSKFGFIPSQADKNILCHDKVRFVGDEVACVAAIDEETAQEALRSIIVEYQELPYVIDTKEALSKDAPKIHNPESNLAFEVHHRFGDTEKAFQESEYIFEDTFITSKVAHCCLETRGCIADYSKGRVTIWSPSQSPHTLRQELARVLGISQQKVRVINLSVGGGFGSRLVMDMKEPLAAILSQKTGRPVKIINTRKEEFSTAKARYPFIITLKSGVNKQGKILAREIEIVGDNGAYNDKGPVIFNTAANFASILYGVPNIKFDGFLVYTNKEPGTAFRGFGNPQIHFAIESQMDMIAEKLGADPMELRLQNANQPGDIAASGAEITSCGLEECLMKAADAAGWSYSHKTHANRGMGMAAMVHGGGSMRAYGFSANDAFIKISEDGMVTVISSAVDVGQGSETVVAQIVAEELGVKYEDVLILGNDTDLVPFDLGCFGSRSTFVCGNAALDAARNAKKEVMAVAAEMLEANPNDLIAAEGKIFVIGSPDKSVSFPDAVNFSIKQRGKPISGKGRFFDPIAKDMPQLPFGKRASTFTFASQVAEVEVDIHTGQVEIIKLVAAHDCGTPINPMAAEGQIEGALCQGIGYSLMEELKYGGAEISNPNFSDYKIPTSVDMPPIRTFLVKTAELDGPFGAKGLGEPGLVPTAPAIANAIYNAVGVRIKELPITPEKILNALKEKGLS